MKKKNFLNFSRYVFLMSSFAVVVMLVIGYRSEVGPLVIVLFASLAVYCMGHAFLKSFSFTIWVFAFVAASMFYPSAFGTWFRFDLGILIVPLIQIIMFGMGTTLNTKDFRRIFTMPWPVFIGIFLQFTVMPLAGYGIAMLFGFDPEVAAGVILIGSCSGGVASNLMTYLAGGNVALSVTMTSCSTLISPVMTPFLMKVLAGKLVPIDFIGMMFSIFNMIIIPIVAGLVANRILYSNNKWANKARSLTFISILSVFLAVVTIFLRKDLFGPLAALKRGIIIGFTLLTVVALTKLIVNSMLNWPKNWMDKALPIVSMSGICFIIAIITARSRDKLLTVGLALVAAAIIHNFIGYIVGYWGARAAKLDEISCRTVSFEVGMQNGGMASGLAMDVLKSVSAALAPAIFGPWMNISGSVLATWWRRKSI
ncbi:MAG: bile acid:sodium symporter family protein [Candidatus Aminicenantes bacterium]|nr:bile acid:sodium symporter family protein [Candidatus Aminicenantes bacterium]